MIKSLLRWSGPLAVLLNVAVVSAEPAVETFMPEDIFALEHAAGPQISPDGKWVIYSRNSFDMIKDNSKRHLWLINTQSGEHTPLLTMAHGYANPTVAGW